MLWSRPIKTPDEHLRSWAARRTRELGRTGAVRKGEMRGLAAKQQAPQRLYHFTSAKFALDDIRNARLKIAQIEDLNDPFELRCMDTSGKVNRMAYELWRQESAARFGVLCFSERWNDILQWSHYADRHRGICLGFDVAGDPKKFGNVHYSNQKIPP